MRSISTKVILSVVEPVVFSRNPIALVRSISTQLLYLDARNKDGVSQSHRFSEVYFHLENSGLVDPDQEPEESQSHRFSEVYFHLFLVAALDNQGLLLVAIPSL